MGSRVDSCVNNSVGDYKVMGILEGPKLDSLLNHRKNLKEIMEKQTLTDDIVAGGQVFDGKGWLDIGSDSKKSSKNLKARREWVIAQLIKKGLVDEALCVINKSLVEDKSQAMAMWVIELVAGKASTVASEGGEIPSAVQIVFKHDAKILEQKKEEGNLLSEGSDTRTS